MKADTYAECCERVRETVHFIHASLDQPLDVESIARIAGFSPFHFQRLYRVLVGETVMDTVRRLRLERAALGLQTSGESATEIAFDAGFESLEAFTRAFRRGFGAPPTAFRHRQWLGSWSPSAVGLHYNPEGEPDFRPIARRGEGVPFHICEVDEVAVLARRHEGPLQFVNKTWLEFAEQLKGEGLALSAQRLYTFAYDLDRQTEVSELTGFVAVEEEVLPQGDLESHRLGSGEHLVARHVGSGHLLADFWHRLWAEALPHSGKTARKGASFQVYPNGLFADDPATFVTDLYIPVKTSHSRSGEAAAMR